MATHEVPDWEGPMATPKQSLFRNPIPASSIDKAKSLFSGCQGRSPSHAFDKETAVETSAQTPEPSTEVPSRKYCGLSPRIWLVIAIISVLALIIGLSVGLTRKSSSKAQNLPLPSNAGIFTGDLTYYSPGPGYGACGYENTSTDAICAVSHIIWDASSTGSDPNANPLCGKMIRITRFDASAGGNHSVDVEVVDRCVGCLSTDLDLSMEMFTGLADEALGRVVGSWAWLA